MARIRLALCLAAIVLVCPVCDLPAAPFDAAVVPLLKRSFFSGREYFVLRGGRAQMIVEADKADLAPAVLYLLFDARDSRQNKAKQTALNFGDGAGFVNTALEVVLGGFAFTAVGHETETRWTAVDGIPAVEAVWWAGGLRVTERIFALADQDAFVRRIQLESVNLAGPEKVTLRLSLPPGACTERDGCLIQKAGKFGLAVGVAGEHPSRAKPAKGVLEIGPFTIAPGRSLSVDTRVAGGDFSGRRRGVVAARFAPKIRPARRAGANAVALGRFVVDRRPTTPWCASSSTRPASACPA